ncbi:hypothetical protein C6P45_003520 [Maudiozyma exigua]|uniref:Uncharacterized protein n=1 Tax=Maudiozyma exigua TaxID=34358 RepID=A0A9P6WEG6_MAUEX|nr:hypothetical protein C6P45_003520 [Kazachstania exigua]
MSEEISNLKDLHISNDEHQQPMTKGKNGIPNQSMTKPITVDANTGEVIVKKFTGKQRIRKGQSQEQYEAELQHFYEVEKGPVRTNIGWMSSWEEFERNLNGLDLEIKHNRLILMSFLHRWYYLRDYASCLKACNEIQLKYKTLNYDEKKMKREINEINYIIEKCSNK